jgi:hypothetical protein
VVKYTENTTFFFSQRFIKVHCHFGFILAVIFVEFINFIYSFYFLFVADDDEPMIQGFSDDEPLVLA